VRPEYHVLLSQNVRNIEFNLQYREMLHEALLIDSTRLAHPTSLISGYISAG